MLISPIYLLLFKIYDWRKFFIYLIFTFIQGSKKTIPVSSDINDTDNLLLPYDLPLKPYQKEGR